MSLGQLNLRASGDRSSRAVAAAKTFCEALLTARAELIEPLLARDARFLDRDAKGLPWRQIRDALTGGQRLRYRAGRALSAEAGALIDDAIIGASRADDDVVVIAGLASRVAPAAIGIGVVVRSQGGRDTIVSAFDPTALMSA